MLIFLNHPWRQLTDCYENLLWIIKYLGRRMFSCTNITIYSVYYTFTFLCFHYTFLKFHWRFTCLNTCCLHQDLHQQRLIVVFGYQWNINQLNQWCYKFTFVNFTFFNYINPTYRLSQNVWDKIFPEIQIWVNPTPFTFPLWNINSDCKSITLRIFSDFLQQSHTAVYFADIFRKHPTNIPLLLQPWMHVRPQPVYVTCFSIVLVVSAAGAEWENITGGGLVHTIISQSTHYRSISRILYTSKTCHLMLRASRCTPQHSKLTPPWHRAPLSTMTHLSEMP